MEAAMDEDNLAINTKRTCTNEMEISVSATEESGVERFWVGNILTAVRRDLIAADVRWSLFVAACQSYKQDSCLRPFPPLFVVDGSKDFAGLMEAVKAVPSFTQLESSVNTLPKKSVQLLHWLLVELKEPSLSVVNKSKVAAVMDLVPCELAATPPTMVLRVGSRPGSAVEARWTELRREHSSVHAYHGSRVENFHSILQHGLQQHMTKHAMFGQGVYLSSELQVCLPYSRTGLGWCHSVVGSLLSVVALCEVLDHPSVSCQVEGDMERLRARPEDSLAGEVPHKLYVVPNSDFLCVRYLLLYKLQPSTVAQQRLNRPSSALLSWLSRNKVTVSLVVYAIMLTSIGLSRSQTFVRCWRELWSSLGFRF